MHAFFNSVIHVYKAHTWADMPVHFAGGMAMAYFLSSCFAALPGGLIDRRLRPVAQFIFAITTTSTIAILWEVTEYTSDRIISTHALGDVLDTLQDLSFGVAGATVFMLVSWGLGRLGRQRPVT